MDKAPLPQTGRSAASQETADGASGGGGGGGEEGFSDSGSIPPLPTVQMIPTVRAPSVVDDVAEDEALLQRHLAACQLPPPPVFAQEAAPPSSAVSQQSAADDPSKARGVAEGVREKHGDYHEDFEEDVRTPPLSPEPPLSADAPPSAAAVASLKGMVAMAKAKEPEVDEAKAAATKADEAKADETKAGVVGVDSLKDSARPVPPAMPPPPASRGASPENLDVPPPLPPSRPPPMLPKSPAAAPSEDHAVVSRKEEQAAVGSKEEPQIETRAEVRDREVEAEPEPEGEGHEDAGEEADDNPPCGDVVFDVPPEPLHSSESLEKPALVKQLEEQLGGLSDAFKGSLLTALGWYTKKVAHRPGCFICVYLLCSFALIGIMFRPFVLDTDFAAFIKADGEAMRNRDAFMLALEEKKGLRDSRRLGAAWPAAEAADDSDDEALLSTRGIDYSIEEEWNDEDEAEEDFEDVFLADAARAEQPSETSVSTPAAATPRRLATNLFLRKELVVIYWAKEGNAFDERVLRDMRDFEETLTSLPGWKAFCEKHIQEKNRGGCDPGESLTAYAWPSHAEKSNEEESFEVKFDGRGTELLPVAALLAYLQEGGSDAQDLKRFFPRDFVPPGVGEASQTLSSTPGIRSVFTFKISVGKSNMAMSQVKEQMAEATAEFEALIQDEVYPLLSNTPQVYRHTRMFYAGDVISGYEITHTLFQDCLFAVGSLGFVMLYMWFHTGNLCVACTSLFLIFLSIPVAYVLAPAAKTTIASFLSLFLITGIGSDVVFVFTDFWEQGSHMKDVDKRLSFMIKNAGKSCLATSLTTSVSFFANLASALQPLREFGLFMGLCVMSAFGLILMILPPVLVVNQRCCKRKVRTRTVDISNGQSDSLAIVPSKKSGVSCCPTGTGAKRDLSRGKQFTFNMIGWISNCPGFVVMFTTVLVAIFAVGVVMGVRLDQGVPAIFPPGHNQVDGPDIFGKFEVVDKLSAGFPESGSFCALTDPGSTCELHWCDITSENMIVDIKPAEAKCFVSPILAVEEEEQNVKEPVAQPTTEGCHAMIVSSRLVTPTSIANDAWSQTFQQLASDVTNASYGFPMVSFIERRPVGMEDWNSGAVRTMRVFDAGRLVAYDDRDNATKLCTLETICFYEAPLCHLPGWRHSGTYNVSRPTRRLLSHGQEERKSEAFFGYTAPRQPVRSLAQDTSYPVAPILSSSRRMAATIDPRKQIDVTVLWGLRPARFTPLVGPPTETWSFDPTFEPDNPWAQRSMMSVCEDMPEELLVVKSECWIAKFAEYQRKLNKKFPSRDFNEDISDWWLDSSSGVIPAVSIWMLDGQVKAVKMAFWVNVDKYQSSGDILEYMKKWNAFIGNINREASMSADFAWHTAAAWVRAEAEVAIIGSTKDTIIISAVCAFSAMLVFTLNFTLAATVLLLVLGIILGLAFFMVSIMGWAIGSIEVISLVVFVGYSVTYALHIAHHYAVTMENDPEMLVMEAKARARRLQRGGKAQPPSSSVDAEAGGAPDAIVLTDRELRVARTRMSVLHLGGATLSSAASTLGSSFFLLFCTLNIFVKLGSVVIAVTALSIVFALTALPAAMMLFGPSLRPWFFQYAFKAASFCKSIAERTLRAGRRRPESAGADQEEPLVKGMVVSS
eukprot:TRINITY_DN6244_c0_g1_i1.p1 TRINITY_DN6244_c0_g1~~TRINITY_DN6244_c0_g1_i1.p1  ORF type:complete len:1637 (+),score=371.52 TRINITY_DN6244_c0_g1_i1:85-4995(+)